MVGAWFGFIPSEHTHFIVYEAPHVEALQNFSMEPEVRAASAYDSQEIKIVKNLEEISKQLQQS
jgi:hypothetical protein